VTNYSDNGLAANTEYYYRVRASNTGGHSDYANEANATTLPNAPAAPSSLAATTVSGSRIDLAWTDNADNEVGFKIERKTGAAGTFAEIATVGADFNSYSNTGLTESTEYFYRVRAYNTGGHSDYANESSATTVPSAPSGLTATTISNTQINLAWTDNSSDENGFKIERKTGPAGTYAEIGAVGAEVTSFSNVSLSANTKYFYRVRAYNAGGNSPYSTEANATTLKNVPAAPTTLAATPASNTQINLAWTDNSANEDGFKIERKTGAAGTYAEMATLGPNVTTYSSLGLDPFTEYYYQVRAYNNGGNSAYSNEANATTLPNAPSAPSSLTATTMNQTQIDLAWTDNADNEVNFTIERKTGAAGTYAEITTVGANVTSYSDNGLNPATEYFYRVHASNTGGNSAYSNEANATTLPNPPAAPSSLTATAASNTQIDLAWTDNANNEANFKIERKTGAAGTYAEIATVGANVANYSDTGLDPITKYYYRVRASNTGGQSAYADEANATTLPNPPAAPSSLTATTISQTQIDLAWTDNASDEVGFKIERKTGAAGTYVEIATVGADVTSFSNTGLAANTEYFYRVRANNTGGHSAYTNEANATTLPNTPGAPSGLAAITMSNTQIDLAWTDNSDNEVSFKIERKTGAAGTYAEIATVGASVTNYSDTGLDPITEYYYRVRASNTGGQSAYSNEANATTLPNAPSAPSSLSATTMSNTQINLAWTDNADNETGFKIERKTGAAGTYAEIGTVGANVTNYSDNSLSPITEYYYRVRASNTGGHSAYSNETNTTTLPNAPKAPGSLTATTVSQTQINLAWADSSDNEVSFKIERKTGVAGTYAEIGTAGANVTNYSDTGLTANTEYYYRVRASNTGGHSAYSNEANATTLPNPPSAPSSLSATAVINRQVNLAWTDGANNETGFKVERKTGAAGTYAEIATLAANATAHSDTGLTASTEYYYRVRAFNTGGNSAYSNEANTTTLPNPPSAPSSLTASAVGTTQINLAWTDNASDETGFKIERKTGAAGTYAEIATVSANVTSYSSTGLVVNTTYYYRVRASNTGGNSAYSNEANATTPSGGNLALNKPITASSTDSTSDASRAVDGNTTTYWRSGFVNSSSPPEWLQVELDPSSNMPIGRAVVTWYQNYHAEEYDFQLSTDGTNWTTVYTNNAGVLGTQDFTFTTTMARFARLYLRKNSKSNYRVAELEVYAGSLTKEAASGVAAENIPTTITLEQNYPNPFNPSTTIAYSLPAGAQVSLKVVNIAGQEVATLVDGYQDRGIYRMTFNGRRLPSGVYYAVLKAGEVTQVRRMTLMK
jgi:titin